MRISTDPTAKRTCSMNLVSMKRAMILGILVTGATGCQDLPTIDPFGARAVCAPPGTGSYAVPGGTSTEYYNNPNPAATPSPGPGASSSVIGRTSTILPTSGVGEATSSLRHASVNRESGAVENSVLIIATTPASGGSPTEAPLQIVENEIPTTASVVARPAGFAQSFGPAEPARFQPAGTVVSLDTKAPVESSSLNLSGAAGSGTSGKPESLPDSGTLNWKPTR